MLLLLLAAIYSSDISDQELQLRWEKDPASLGSISLGFVDRGRVINAVQMPEGDAWICTRPHLCWGTQETVDALTAAFRAVRAQFPKSSPARLSQIGKREGGWLPPHRSHQAGRDADIGFFWKRDDNEPPPVRRSGFLDVPRTWALIRALIAVSDVQVILVDRGIQKVLRRYALRLGEDPAWVERVFGDRKPALIQHEEHHRDHLHVRFYSPRSQEMALRIQPILPLRPEQNLALHKVRRGETLGRIARLYRSAAATIRQINHLRGSFLAAGQQLLVPLRGECATCALPPPLVVPPRLLPPPTAHVASLSTR